MVTASGDNTARVWDAATGRPLGAPLTHQDKVWSAAFSPDGARVVTASRDQHRAGLGRGHRPAAGRPPRASKLGHERSLQPRRRARGHRERGPQTRAVWSLLAVTTRAPSGLKAALQTLS